MFDAHCYLHHLPAPAEPWLAAARQAGVRGLAVPCTHPDEAEAAWAIASRHPDVVWGVGLHPWRLQEGQLDADLRALTTAATRRRPGPATVGEVGLDFARARDARARDLQEDALAAQLDLADRLGLPVALHVVRAHGAMLNLLERRGAPAAGGLVHGFSAPVEVAKRYLALGLHLSVGPRVTHPASRKLRAVLPQLPLERLLVETDSPDQAPEPHRSRARAAGGRARGQPAWLPWVVSEVAALRGEDTGRIARQTERNARRLFGLPMSPDPEGAHGPTA